MIQLQDRSDSTSPSLGSVSTSRREGRCIVLETEAPWSGSDESGHIWCRRLESLHERVDESDKTG